MTEPGESSGWVRSEKPPSLRRWFVGCGAVLVIVAVMVAIIVALVLQSSIPRMFAASVAIQTEADEHVSAANFFWNFGSEPVFQIILANGVPSSVAQDLGCQTIERALADNGLAGTHWTIYANDYHPILDSAEAHCT